MLEAPDWLVIASAEACDRQEERLVGGYRSGPVSILDPAVAARCDRFQVTITVRVILVDIVGKKLDGFQSPRSKSIELFRSESTKEQSDRHETFHNPFREWDAKRRIEERGGELSELLEGED